MIEIEKLIIARFDKIEDKLDVLEAKVNKAHGGYVLFILMIGVFVSLKGMGIL